MIALSLYVGQTPAAEAQLVLESLACLYAALIAGYLFPVIDVAMYMVNFAPFLMVTKYTEPLRGYVDSHHFCIQWRCVFSGDAAGAVVPATIGVFVMVRIALGWY